MNSLEYIRNYCNISQSFLAELIGVSRQSIYLWETEKKELPPKRRKQLSELFGLEESFFGEINEDIIDEIYQKKMYVHTLNEKTYYCFKEHENAVYGGGRGIYQYNYNEIKHTMQIPTPLNDRLDMCKKNIQNLLESIQELSQELDGNPTLQARMACRNRVDRAFTGLVCSVQQISKKGSGEKMIYWHTLWDIVSAIGLAYGAIEEEDLEKENDDLENNPYTTSASWIIELAETIKKRNDNGCAKIKKK